MSLQDNIENAFEKIYEDEEPTFEELKNFTFKHYLKFNVSLEVLEKYDIEIQANGKFQLFGFIECNRQTVISKDLLLDTISKFKKVKSTYLSCDIELDENPLFSKSKKLFLDFIKIIQRYGELDLDFKYAPGGTEYLKAKERFDDYKN